MFSIDSCNVCWKCKECKCYDECLADLDVFQCDIDYTDCECCPCAIKSDKCFMPEDDA